MRKAFSSIFAGAVAVALATPGFAQPTLVNVFESTAITTANAIEYHGPTGLLLLGGTTGVQSVSRTTGSGATALAGFSGPTAALAVSRSTGKIVAGSANGSLTIWNSPTDAAPVTTKSISLADAAGALITGNLVSLDLVGNVLVAGSTNSGTNDTVEYVGYNLSSGPVLTPVLAWRLDGSAAAPFGNNYGISASESLSLLAGTDAGNGLTYATLTFNPATLSSSYVSTFVDNEDNFWVDGIDLLEEGDNNIGYVGFGSGFGRKAIDGDASAVVTAGYRVVDTGDSPLAGNEIRLLNATGNIVTAVTLPAGFDALRKRVAEGGDVVSFAVPASVADWSLF